MDLAKGHIAALKKLKDNCGCKVNRRNVVGNKVHLKNEEVFADVQTTVLFFSSFVNVFVFVLSLCEHWTSLDPESTLGLFLLVFRSTTWEPEQATLSSRWSKPWRKHQEER